MCVCVQCSDVWDELRINWMLHVFFLFFFRSEFSSVEISGFGSVGEKMKVRLNYLLIAHKNISILNERQEKNEITTE